MEGLALAIAVASLCMLVLPALLGGGLGYFALRSSGKQGLGAVLGAVAGAVFGVLGVTMTFFESTWDPPISVMIEVPPGFHHEAVYLLEDPTAPELEWTGFDIPLTSPTAHVRAPMSGVVRVRSLGRVRTSAREGYLVNGQRAPGQAMMDLPPGLGASAVFEFDFAEWPGREPSIADLPPTAVVELLRAREAER